VSYVLFIKGELLKMNLRITIGVWCVLVLFVAGSFSFSMAQSMEQPVVLKHSSMLYVGGSGPGNYSKIQDAVDNASDGDTVFVYDDSAPYYESVIINVSIHLLGENRNTTSIEGGKYAVSIFVDGVTVSGFRISNVGDFWNCCGFYVTSQGNNISDNNIINNLRINGVFLDGASYNTVSGNLIENNMFHGIRVEYASHNVIMNNVIVNNRGYGINLYEVQDTILVGNTVRESFLDGLTLGGYCVNNIISHNNFIDNPGNAYDATGNLWDDGTVGNYWSDYAGSDSDGDGIGDTPYLIPGNMSQDRFPLMAPYESHPVNVTITITGAVGLTVSVRNQGAEDVLYLDWESHLTGGFVLLPSQRVSQGAILYLGSGDELMIQRVNPLVGVGIIELTVTVGKTTESLRGLLLFFVFIPLSV
jgi:parallel beta-helix repeat protein